MQIQLTDDEVNVLRSLFDDYLPQLRLEVARTDGREYRRDLLRRQDLCEKLCADLEPVAVVA